MFYPEEMDCLVYSEGERVDLFDARTGRILAEFEVWPPSECLVPMKERTEIDAREIGIQRARIRTQADGPGSSSYCGDPLKVQEVASSHEARIYELELSCVNEEFPNPDDTDENTGGDTVITDAEPIITSIGKKGPTYFVDISQSWLKRVLMADPLGVDPRYHGIIAPAVSVDLRKILATIKTIKTFPVPKPLGNCIQDLR